MKALSRFFTLLVFWLPSSPTLAVTNAQLVDYLNYISGQVGGDRLTADQLQAIDASGREAAVDILRSWTDSEAFVKSARNFLETKIGTSGTNGDIDFDRPGRLMEDLVRNNLPYADLLSRCNSNDGTDVYCDTLSLDRIGVINTRAFLVAANGRFNLARARTLFKQFLCLSYPMSETVEPRAPKAHLRPLFAADTGDNQNGNGASCYLCHGQFAWHAQLFAHYDQFGAFAPFIDGAQDPNGEPGRSIGGLYASHFLSPAMAGGSASQILGHPVSNLREAIGVVAESDEFKQCTTREVLRYFLKLDRVQSSEIPALLIRGIVERTLAVNSNPTFRDYVLQALTDDHVIESVVAPLSTGRK